jgi:hypothetical protein
MGGDGGFPPAGPWECGLAGEGSCTCTNAPGTQMGLPNCSSSNTNCCAACNDVGDPYQFCACETIDPTQGMCIVADTICGQNQNLYMNAQLVNSCPM